MEFFVKKKSIFIIILIVLILLVCTRLFFRLPATSINDDDEAWHAVNVYEMYQNNTFLINTCRGEIDYYNSKPPMAFWGTLICFHLFGINMLTLKITAAFAGFLTCLITLLFLYKKCGIKTAIFFVTSFFVLNKIYDYHGFRSANLDGVYILFFTLAMLTLWAAIENNVYLILFGFWVGCAFLTKCAHISSLVLIAFLSIPLLKRKWRWKHFCGCIFACLTPILLWMVARYQYDGSKFLMATVGEIVAKTSSSPTGYYIKIAMKEPIICILIIVCVLYYMLVVLVGRDKKTNENGQDFWIREIQENYIVWLWFLVPMVVFSAAGNHSDWYVYPSYVGACILLAIYFNKLLEIVKKPQIKAICMIGFIGIAVIFGCRKIYFYRFLGNGGGRCERIQALCEDLKGDYDQEYDGKKIYMATPFQKETEGVNTEWYIEFIALFDIYADMICVDGGVEGFLSEEDALLVLDKELWDDYAALLTGYYIVEDGDGYLMFYSKTYAEM